MTLGQSGQHLRALSFSFVNGDSRNTLYAAATAI